MIYLYIESIVRTDKQLYSVNGKKGFMTYQSLCRTKVRCFNSSFLKSNKHSYINTSKSDLRVISN